MWDRLLHPTFIKVPGWDAFNPFRLRSAILAPQPERVIRFSVASGLGSPAELSQLGLWPASREVTDGRGRDQD